MVETSTERGTGSIPGQKTKIPYALRYSAPKMSDNPVAERGELLSSCCIVLGLDHLALGFFFCSSCSWPLSDPSLPLSLEHGTLASHMHPCFSTVCPAGWTPGSDTIKPNVDDSKEYFAKHN